MRVVCSVYDRKGIEFGMLFLARTQVEAARIFADSLKGQQSVIGMHPEDFLLAQVGTFDESTGDLVGLYSVICDATEVVSASGVSGVENRLSLEDRWSRKITGEDIAAAGLTPEELSAIPQERRA